MKTQSAAQNAVAEAAYTFMLSSNKEAAKRIQLLSEMSEHLINIMTEGIGEDNFIIKESRKLLEQTASAEKDRLMMVEIVENMEAARHARL